VAGCKPAALRRLGYAPILNVPSRARLYHDGARVALSTDHRSTRARPAPLRVPVYAVADLRYASRHAADSSMTASRVRRGVGSKTAAMIRRHARDYTCDTRPRCAPSGGRLGARASVARRAPSSCSRASRSSSTDPAGRSRASAACRRFGYGAENRRASGGDGTRLATTSTARTANASRAVDGTMVRAEGLEPSISRLSAERPGH
jgi:hypothetical protein